MKFFRGAYIVWVFFRYGLDDLLLSSAPHGGLRMLSRVLSLGRRYNTPRGARLRMALESLGPIFIKFGQVLSCCRPMSLSNSPSCRTACRRSRPRYR